MADERDTADEMPTASAAAWNASNTSEQSGPPPPPIPDRIGAFSIKSVIASGGMGTVYLAVQDQPHRKVALKVMKKGIASRSALRRFELESQTLARLKHPNVAQVYDAGTHDDGAGGVPYFAMEYIVGAKTITDYATEKKLGIRERLELFAKVADAVHHGHQKGIIHRDLKPGNILVDASDEPKIIDFGVARSTDSDMAVTTLQTDMGQLIGTLQYMSPEQCAADPDDIDTRSDVYALGVVLYELLCERVPYDVTRVAIHEAARVIKEESPANPSTLDRTLRGDVETITLKALEKDRDRRYRSASDLADDLRSYLEGQPISARPPSIVYQLERFAARNKLRLTAVASAIVVVALIVVSATVYARLEAARLERDLSLARQEEADLVSALVRSSERYVTQDAKGVLQRLADRILAGEGSAEDAQRLTHALVRVTFEGRPIQERSEPTCQVNFGSARHVFVNGIGALLQPRLRLNGHPWQAFRSVLKGFSDGGSTGYAYNIEPLRIGSNRLEGGIEARLVRLAKDGTSLSTKPVAGEDYLEVLTAPILLEFPTIRLTAVDELPESYPTLIENKRLRTLLEEEAGFEPLVLSTNETGSLVVTVAGTLRISEVSVAVDVGLRRVGSLKLHEPLFGLVIHDDVIGMRSFDVGMFEQTRGQFGQGFRMVLSLRDENPAVREALKSAGDCELAITSSRATALWHPQVREYLSVDHVWTVPIERDDE